MGEEVAEYNGAYKASGYACEFGEKEWSIPNCWAWIYWNCSGFSDERLWPIVEYMTFNFCLVDWSNYKCSQNASDDEPV
jgi:pyruvate dehydrogenase E1 component beta subunit